MNPATDPERPRVAVAHDYLTQRGGAERVVLSMVHAFPGAAVFTSFYEPKTTFSEFAHVDVRVHGLNRISILRTNHRLALPFLAPAFAGRRVDAELVVCSSSGWSHAVQPTGRKVVYCYSPARWLYQAERYLGEGPSLERVALGAMRSPLRRWDRRAAATADSYVAISRMVRDQIREVYSRDCEVLPAPVTIDVDAPRSAVPGIEPGFLLCVARLLPYKNVGAIIDAFRRIPRTQLVVVGTGPLAGVLSADAPSNVRLVGSVSEAELRWLYANSSGVVAAAYEDYGLTPLEGASFGKPSVALRWGGFLDTVVEGTTGVFFDAPEPIKIANAIAVLEAERWEGEVISEHAGQFDEVHFVQRLQGIVENELSGLNR